jgi:hypothetical protein
LKHPASCFIEFLQDFFMLAFYFQYVLTVFWQEGGCAK